MAWPDRSSRNRNVAGNSDGAYTTERVYNSSRQERSGDSASAILQLPFWHCILRLTVRERIAAGRRRPRSLAVFTKSTGARVLASGLALTCTAGDLSFPSALQPEGELSLYIRCRCSQRSFPDTILDCDAWAAAGSKQAHPRERLAAYATGTDKADRP